MTLEERFLEPPGWQWQERLETRSGEYLRYGWAVPEKPVAFVVILPGLSEYCEKYFEVARDLLERSMAVAVLDWRGQGLSWRHLPDRTKRHHDDFLNDIADAYAMIDTISKIPALQGFPKILLGHSMGGHIALRFLHDYPDMFSAAILSSPMQGIYLPYDGQGLVRRAIGFVCRAGWSEHYIPGGMPWSEKYFDLNMMQLTSDKPRAEMQRHWMTYKPELQPGGVTFGWLHAALRSIKCSTRADFLEKIKTPVLICIAGRERIVSNRATEKSAQRLPNAQILRIDGALHEILMERDTYRNRFWHAFDAFMDKCGIAG